MTDSPAEAVVKTDFGAIMRKNFDYPMPEMTDRAIDTFEKLEAAFDAPDDPRRFVEPGDNQIAGFGDGFERNAAASIESVKSLRPTSLFTEA